MNRTPPPFFVSIPHSGEKIPAEVTWLRDLAEPVLMCDVDRFVDQLYSEVIDELSLPAVIAEWHRYVVDLNRLPTDVDQSSVVGAPNPAGEFTTGLHWVKTTRGQTLMAEPISMELHQSLVENYFEPFHEKVRAKYKDFFAQDFSKVYQLDAHSMPSMGTSAHRDPGEQRAEIVVSDSKGQSCDPQFFELVFRSFQDQGLNVGKNWPYFGGRVTQTYGKPELGQHAVQVEINRALYMDEEKKTLLPKKATELQGAITRAVKNIYSGLSRGDF